MNLNNSVNLLNSVNEKENKIIKSYNAIKIEILHNLTSKYKSFQNLVVNPLENIDKVNFIILNPDEHKVRILEKKHDYYDITFLINTEDYSVKTSEILINDDEDYIILSSSYKYNFLLRKNDYPKRYNELKRIIFDAKFSVLNNVSSLNESSLSLLTVFIRKDFICYMGNKIYDHIEDLFETKKIDDFGRIYFIRNVEIISQNNDKITINFTNQFNGIQTYEFDIKNIFISKNCFFIVIINNNLLNLYIGRYYDDFYNNLAYNPNINFCNYNKEL